MIAAPARFGGALQAGPDDRLYCSLDGSDYLAVIPNPNVRGAGCGYQENGVYLGGRVRLAACPTSPLSAPGRRWPLRSWRPARARR